MHGYVAMLRGKRIEIRAENLYEAKRVAIGVLKPSKRDMGTLVVMLAELNDGAPVVHKAVD